MHSETRTPTRKTTMFRFLQLLVCFFACAGAFEVSMSRRAILSRVAAAAPLAAAGAAFADADNR